MNIDWQTFVGIGAFVVALIPFLYAIFGQHND